MDNDLGDFFKLLGGALLLVVLVIAIGIAASVAFNKLECERYQRLSPNYNWSFSFYGGCLVQTHSGRWISPDNFFQLEQMP